MRRLICLLFLFMLACAGGTSVDVVTPDVHQDNRAPEPDYSEPDSGEDSREVQQVQCQTDADCEDHNDCTIDDCDWFKKCKHSAVTGKACDDGNVCTVDETCSSEGECTSEEMVECDDFDPCTDQWCDPEKGCLFDLAQDGTLCDDENPCTEGDGCSAGECAGQFIACPAPGPCINSSCDVLTGQCTDTPVSNLPCDDLNACTNGDQCQDGECIPGAAVDCEDGDICTLDTCAGLPKDEGGGCQHQPALGQPCDDDNPCTENDQCNQEAVCLGTALNCDDDNQCTADLCNPTQGCYHQELNGQPCEDGDACTTGDKCTSGYCQPGGPKNCSDALACTNDYCAPDGQCGHLPSDALCDDGLACTNGKCDPLAGCIQQPNNGLCKDNKPCTKDVCDPLQGCQNIPQEGYYNGLLCCIADNVPCNDGNTCTVDSCNQALSQCMNNPIPDGYPCSDGLDCTQNDKCLAGFCACSDGNMCTLDSCAEDGSCVHTAVTCVPNEICWESVCNPYTGKCLAKSVDCDDADPCTDDLCKLPDGCSNQPKDCAPDEPEPCVLYACDPETGCFAQPLECDDGTECTLDDHCDPVIGLCISTPLDCDDSDPCTDDWCDGPTAQCQHEPLDCDDANGCTQDVCLPNVGCTNLPAPEAVCWSHDQCDDDNLCTQDSCALAGSCTCANVASQPGCTPVDACHQSCCDPETGQMTIVETPDCFYNCYNDYDCRADHGSLLDEMGLCSTEQCSFVNSLLGECVYQPLACDDGKPCTMDWCETGVGCLYLPTDCTQAACDTDADCDDGLKCTTHVCLQGKCDVFVVGCDDEDPCTKDWCSPYTGSCTSANVDDCQTDCTLGDESFCDDDNLCTMDGCSDLNGECIYAVISCNDLDPCTFDYCVPDTGCVFDMLEGCQGCTSDEQCDDGNLCTEDSCVSAHPEGQQDAEYMTDGFHHPSAYCTHKSLCSD